MTSKKNVLLYCGATGDEQFVCSSLEMQERKLREYCDSNGYEVVGVYHENSPALTFGTERPMIKKMYDYCKSNSGQIDKILSLNWGRYSRSLEGIFACKRIFYDELGVEINTIESPICFTDTEWATIIINSYR